VEARPMPALVATPAPGAEADAALGIAGS
jgi:hypothetical protein